MGNVCLRPCDLRVFLLVIIHIAAGFRLDVSFPGHRYEDVLTCQEFSEPGSTSSVTSSRDLQQTTIWDDLSGKSSVSLHRCRYILNNTYNVQGNFSDELYLDDPFLLSYLEEMPFRHNFVTCKVEFSNTKGEKGFPTTKRRYARIARGLSLPCNVSSGVQNTSLIGPGEVELDWVKSSDNLLQIKLKNISPSNEGAYTCQDDVMSMWNVIVLGELNITVHASSPTCIHYTTEQLVCRTSEDVVFEGWVHRWGNVTLREEPGTKLAGNSTRTESTFVIRLCGYQDAGTYSCRVRDKTGEIISKSSSIQVYAPPVITNEEVVFPSQIQASIQVQFYSNPSSYTVTWLRHGRNLTNYKNYDLDTTEQGIELKVFRKTIVTRGYLAVLNISSLNSSDVGPYSIMIQNGFGEATSTIDVQLPKPDSLINTMHVYIIVGSIGGLILVLAAVGIGTRCTNCTCRNEKMDPLKKQNCVSLDDLLEGSSRRSRLIAMNHT